MLVDRKLEIYKEGSQRYHGELLLLPNTVIATPERRGEVGADAVSWLGNRKYLEAGFFFVGTLVPQRLKLFQVRPRDPDPAHPPRALSQGMYARMYGLTSMLGWLSARRPSRQTTGSVWCVVRWPDWTPWRSWAARGHRRRGAHLALRMC